MTDRDLSGFFADLARLYPDLDTTFLRGMDGAFEEVGVSGGSTLMRRGDPCGRTFHTYQRAFGGNTGG